jgi:Ca-activated chloride channel family protein
MKKIVFFVTLITVLVLSGGAAFAGNVDLEVSVSNPYLLVGERQSVYLKVGLTGTEPAGTFVRPTANVAIVLDRSGSMDGEKLRQAKEAALLAVDMLEDTDIVSIVTYDDTVQVLVPATRVSERRYIRRRIESIYAGGSTALFAGVSKGADEVSKFLDGRNVNRVILLSDGLANVGPDSPMALGNLGEALKRTGISVTTIGLGLGYNEDLMVRLAQKSDGNHSFVENTVDLARIFQYEFRDILSVSAQDIRIEITCPEGVTPIRVLGREAEIIGNKVYTSISQLYGSKERYLLVELQVPPKDEGNRMDVAEVSIEYDDIETHRREYRSAKSSVSFTRSESVVETSKDKPVIVEAVKQIATETAEEAIQLRDEGRADEARELLEKNAEFLYDEAEELDSEELEDLGAASGADASVIEDESQWNANRKRMKAENYELQSQQSY